MELGEYIAVLRRRWLSIAAGGLLGLIIAGIMAMAATPQYKASTNVFFSLSGTDNVNDLAQGSTYTQNLVTSYSHVVTMPVVLNPVIAELKLDTTAQRLAHQISATAEPDSVILRISVSDPSATTAARIANAVGKQLPVTVGDLSPVGKGTGRTVVVSTVAPARVPTVAATPRTKLDLAIGLVIGLAAGVAYAVVRQLFDRGVHSEDEVRQLTGAPVLASIGFDRATASRPTPAAPAVGQAAEAFRVLRTNVHAARSTGRGRCILVTSPRDGDGKTSTAINLAMVMAEAGARVLLVDADLRHPSIAEHLRVGNDVGLTTAVSARPGRIPVTSTVRRNLDVLPAGPPRLNPSELLASVSMHELLGELAEHYDTIVLDGTSLNIVTDAAAVARYADATVLVVDDSRCREEELVHSVKTLELAGGALLGSVRNKVAGSGTLSSLRRFTPRRHVTLMRDTAPVLPVNLVDSPAPRSG